MKKFLTIVGGIALAALILAVAATAWFYLTFCGGHPHGIC